MALNSLKALTLALVLVTSATQAHIDVHSEEYNTIASVEVSEIATEFQQQKNMYPDPWSPFYGLPGLPTKSGGINLYAIGQILSISHWFTVLGEEIYKLVHLGTPVVRTNFAPVTVVPTRGGQPVDILDTEGWEIPVKKTYLLTTKNLYGVEVVKFRYSVIFAYGGSYDGRGAYITGAQIVPESVKANWGFDFDSSMQLVEVSNIGTAKQPVAQLVIQLNYKVKSLLDSDAGENKFVLTGNGKFRAL